MRKRHSTHESQDLRLRAAGVFVLLLIMLGVVLPFWMEYKSLSTPTVSRGVSGAHVKAYNSRKRYFCPACGATISVPYWSNEASRPREPLPFLMLEKLTTSAWELSFLSAGMPRRDLAPIPKDAGIRKE